MKQRWWSGLVLAAALKMGAALQAQSPASEAPTPQGAGERAGPMTTLKVTTRLVILDVVVTDKHGIPVLDLKRDDFSVTEDKEPQRVRSVEPPSAHALPPGSVVHSSADLGKIGSSPVNIVVLDELNTPFEDNAFSRFSAQKFLKAQPSVMPPTTLLVVSDKSFSVLQDYTQDRGVLEAALKRDQAQYPWRLNRNGNAGPEAVVRLGQSLNALEEIAQSAAGTPGRKNIIWVGKGFPSADLTNLDEAASKPVLDAIKRCTDLLLTSRVTLYVVDPTPLSSATYDTSTPGDLATLEEETDTEPFDNSIRFSTLAPMTGGRVLSARNDVDREIATSISEGSNYYTVAYTPDNPSDTPGEYRHVRVALSRPGLTVTTRDGYYTQSQPGVVSASQDPEERKTQQNTEVLDVANAALSKLVYNGVKVRAAAGTPGHVTLAIADSSLTWQPGEDGLSQAPVEIVAVCFNAKGKVLSHTTLDRTVTSKSANAKPNLEEIVSLPVTVPTGTARLRLVVRDAGTGHLGSADISNP